MKRKSITIALTLLLVASLAFAGMNEKGKGMNAEHKMKGENYQLLTEDERDKVADAKRDFEKKAILLRADVKVLYMELDELVAAGKSGNAKLDELNAAKNKLSKEKLDHQVAVRKIVGEEKYQKMQMYKKMTHKKQGGNMMGGRGYNNNSPHWNTPRNVK
ncbi:MAG: hypothetical protein J7L40_04135 [Candidatus Marinimicrobia bacterium]|nr:hypothetical protein [Candidatus Neomarinimicrobiota bacterium]